ncbi:acylphosphatase [bacterium]|nr:acylphosphatase [bacterium]
MKAEKRIRAKVQGRVQAVGFRFFVQQMAGVYCLTGFVRNRNDASVLVEAQGEKEKVEKFIAQLRKGPRLALVESVTVDWIPRQGNDRDFQICF